jgi:hypothetical protein
MRRGIYGDATFWTPVGILNAQAGAKELRKEGKDRGTVDEHGGWGRQPFATRGGGGGG